MFNWEDLMYAIMGMSSFRYKKHTPCSQHQHTPPKDKWWHLSPPTANKAEWLKLAQIVGS